MNNAVQHQAMQPCRLSKPRHFEREACLIFYLLLLPYQSNAMTSFRRALRPSSSLHKSTSISRPTVCMQMMDTQLFRVDGTAVTHSSHWLRPCRGSSFGRLTCLAATNRFIPARVPYHLPATYIRPYNIQYSSLFPYCL